MYFLVLLNHRLIHIILLDPEFRSDIHCGQAITSDWKLCHAVQDAHADGGKVGMQGLLEPRRQETCVCNFRIRLHDFPCCI